MIQTTVRRVLPLVEPDNIFVVTGQDYIDLVQTQLPMLPVENIVAEPNGKNTAPAIGLGAIHIAQKEPNATIAVLTADHIIPDETAFRNALSAAVEVATEGKFVTLGITPTGPETGYGYIHRGANLGQYQAQSVYIVEEFLEKPSLAKAEEFYQSGQYYWNSGMFIWQASDLFKALSQYMPDLHEKLNQIKAVLSQPQAEETLIKVWNKIKSESIDFGLMEKVDNVAVVPLNAGWNDVGSWSALYDELAQSDDDTVVLNAQHLEVDSSGLLIQGTGKLIATIGLKDVVIIETDDALLVCAKDKTQDVKTIVNDLKTQKKDIYL